jgi:oligopeptide transport system permease protein
MKISKLSLVLLGSIILAALLGPQLSQWDYEEIDWDAIETPPSSQHWFGTDIVGRDLFARTMEGAQVSLTVAVIAVTVSLAIGIPWGAFAGLMGGRIDEFMMRIVDGIYCLPGILILILLLVVFDRNTYLLFAALGAISWLNIARIVRGQTLRLKHAPFIDAARAMGARPGYILAKHVIPNILGPIVVYTTLAVPYIILAESFISFLGLGIQEPQTSWGVLVADGAQTIETSPWQIIFPGFFLAATIWSCNTLGDTMRDGLDSRDQVF